MLRSSLARSIKKYGNETESQNVGWFITALESDSGVNENSNASESTVISKDGIKINLAYLLPTRKIETLSAGMIDSSSLTRYLDRKYRETLYTTKTLLGSMAKTIQKLPSVIQTGTEATVKELLEAKILGLTDFDNKHQQISKFGDSCVGDNEAEYWNQFKVMYNIDALLETKAKSAEINMDEAGKVAQKNASGQLENLALYLKIREAQLQVLLIVRYLVIQLGDIESSQELIKPQDSIQQAPQRRLVRPRKKLQKKVTQQPVKLVKDEKYYRGLLQGYLDRFLIWDIIVDSKQPEQGDLLKDENISSLNYFKHLLLPFYYQESPHLMKYIRNKLSGNLVNSGKSVKRAKETRHEKPVIKRSKTVMESPEMDLRVSKTVKKTNSVGGFSAKVLERREVDFSFSRPKVNIDARLQSFSASEKVLKKPKSLGKSKSVAQSSVSQIEATPMKNAANNPYNSMKTTFKKSLTGELSKIAESPLIALETPEKAVPGNLIEIVSPDTIISPQTIMSLDSGLSDIEFAGLTQTPSKKRLYDGNFSLNSAIKIDSVAENDTDKDSDSDIDYNIYNSETETDKQARQALKERLLQH